MKPNKTYDKYLSEDEFFFDENTFQKGGSLRQDNEFFDDKDYVVHDVVGVKRTDLSKGENWEILKNNKVTLVLKGSRFSAEERSFFRTTDGVSFIINGFKLGWGNVSEYKRQIKKFLKIKRRAEKRTGKK